MLENFRGLRKFFADRSYQKRGNFRAKYAKHAKATQP
jgi:hypothetical protein